MGLSLFGGSHTIGNLMDDWQLDSLGVGVTFAF